MDDTIEQRIEILDQLLQKTVECDDDSVSLSLVAREGLLDSLLVLYDECHENLIHSNKLVAAFVKKYAGTIAEVRRLRIKASDFEVKDVIGRGHFGEVQVVREKHTETVYAMKTLRKQETLAQPEKIDSTKTCLKESCKNWLRMTGDPLVQVHLHFRFWFKGPGKRWLLKADDPLIELSFFDEERDIMARATSPWITKLHYAFQDAHMLYLIMEFHAGGDLLSLLARHDDIFGEKMARFYLAEIVLALNDLHIMGYVHRDLKPENVLIDCEGHIKLADFGSAAKLSPDMLVSSKMPVGTPDYVSPELLNSMNNDRLSNNYGREVDWWSLGVCMYEMLYGKTPFTDEGGSMVATYSNIMNYKNCLKYPPTSAVSEEAKDLIAHLLIEKNKRLNCIQIKNHGFFGTVQWDSMRKETPPFVPHLESLDDTSNFEEFEKIKHPVPLEDPRSQREFTGRDLPFIGFTYVKKDNKLKKDMSKKHDTVTEKEIDIDTSISTKQKRRSTSVDVTLTVKIAEIKKLREKCNNLEESECNLKKQVEQLRLKVEDKEEMVSKLTLESEAYQKDLENYIAKTNRLSKQIEVMVEERDSVENKAEQFVGELSDMNSQARQLEEEIYKLHIEELQEVISQLEEEKASLVRKTVLKENETKSYKEQLAASQKNASKLQFRLDKERRKSRDDQKRDLALLENREDLWRTQLEDKNSEIVELNKRISELEDLVEAYEGQEKESMEREQKLREKLRETEKKDEHDNQVDIRVCVKTSSPEKRDKWTSEKIKDLELKMEQYNIAKLAWQQKEEEMKDAIEKLKSEVENKKLLDRLSSQTKETLTKQVELYQSEIAEQRERIKALQESVKLVISENDDERSRTQQRLENKMKDLERQLDMYRDEKKTLLSDVSKYQQESNDKHFKICELERTNTRLTSKIERLERQLDESREREVDIRLRRNQTSDIRIKLAEERVADIEQEKIKLEAQLAELNKTMEDIKSKESDMDKISQELSETLKKENSDLKTKIKDVNKENLDLKSKMNEVRSNVVKFERQVTKCEKNISNLEEEIAAKDVELKNLRRLKSEKVGLEITIKDLQKDLKLKDEEIKKGDESSKELIKLRREKENLETKIKSLEKDIADLKSKQATTQVRRTSQLESIEDLKQEKRFMESRISTLQRQVEQGDSKVVDLERKIAQLTKDSEKLKEISAEVTMLKKEKSGLQDEIKEIRIETERKLKRQAEQNRETQNAEEKLHQEKQKQNKTLDQLQHELNESNLALSEARSSLAATQRQEKQSRNFLESQIRELQQRIFKLEKARGAAEDEQESSSSHTKKRTKELISAMEQEAKSNRIYDGVEAETRKSQLTTELEREVTLLRSQNENLSKKQKELEDRLSAQQREKSASLMEKQLLKDSLAQKEHQCELETQKVEKFRAICSELENQIKDLEAIQEENESKQAEWEKVRTTYETAVSEREAEIEGTSQKLNKLKEARQATQEMAQTVKQQLQTAQAQHKNDLDLLRKQASAAKKETQRYQTLVTEFESQHSKLQTIVEQQKLIIDNDAEEKRKLKEEISKILTENQDNRSENIKLRRNLEEAIDKFELIFGEKIDLENFTEALQGLHFLEKYRFESQLGQQMKLIDYLQELWTDGRKKKGGKLFGKNKDGGPASSVLPLNDLQTALENERKRSNKLQEQMDRLRAENLKQANELLKVKTTLREKMAQEPGTMTPKIKAAVQVLIHSPSSQNGPSALLTPSTKKSTKMLAPPMPTPQRMHHRIPHRFVNGLNTRATKCAVCLGSVQFVKQAAKCQECSLVCHPKCVASVPDTCGLPTEYVRHFSSMIDKHGQHIGNNPCPPTDDEKDMIKMQGWMKVRKTGKQHGWEKRWAKMEGNILLLFNHETDANPVDTFDLNPPETDVTVHSAVSTAELPTTATTDLPYVLRLEHEPLTTCWPGRVLYLMATDFLEKQRWVACLEAAIKNLQEIDATKRTKIKATSLLELCGDKRLELNCSLLLSKQLTLLGADEGLFAVNIHREPPVVTKLNAFESIHQLTYIPHLNLIVLVSGKNRNLLTIDKKLIQLRLGQSKGDETQNVYHEVVENSTGCTVFDTLVYGDAVYMCVGKTDRITVMKYNPNLKKFCIRKDLLVSEPCSCICMADSFAIVGTDKFYQIKLDHPSLEDFVDSKDNSLAFAAFAAAAHSSYPLAVIQVSPQGLPLEFLICFHEFGVYVDSKGRRSRPADMKWSCLPLSFAYREPFLYVTYFNSVQAITVPASKEEIRGKQTSVDLSCPRYLGAALSSGCVFVAASTGVETELFSLKGNDGTTIEYAEDKENRKGSRSNTNSMKYGSQRYVSPKKSGYQTTVRGSNSNSLRRDLSLTSISSNSSASSSSTVSSLQSNV